VASGLEGCLMSASATGHATRLVSLLALCLHEMAEVLAKFQIATAVSHADALISFHQN